MNNLLIVDIGFHKLVMKMPKYIKAVYIAINVTRVVIYNKLQQYMEPGKIF